MLIRQKDTRKKVVSRFCTVWEYDFPNKELGIATSKIHGRHPEHGRILNTKCNEVYMVLSGQGIVHHQSGDFKIKKGDAFFLEKGRWYWVEGRHLHLALPTSPSWYPEQFKQLDDAAK
jgi:mannose-6-phosphate isomerase-like protein (cupin superfamily)